MRIRSFVLAMTLAATAALAIPATASAADPTVSASSGLHGGQKITVTARHLPAATEVWLQQSPREPYGGEDEAYCTNRVRLTTDAAGTLRTRWTLADPVWFRYPYGDPEPQYCRADQCRMWVTVPDGTNYSSVPLRFRGSPATITATPSTGLVDGQRIRVTGTAAGSAGTYVRLTQQSCWSG